MAQGVAWCARELGVPCTVVVPDTRRQTKLAAIERLGGEVVKVPFDDWWQVLVEHALSAGSTASSSTRVSDPAVMAGNGTIGLEILEDLPDVDAVLVPYGGGGLSCGIASALRGAAARGAGLRLPRSTTAAPLAASLAAGRPVDVEYTPSFVDGIGSRERAPRDVAARERSLDGSLVASLERDRRRRAPARRARTASIAEGAGRDVGRRGAGGQAGGGQDRLRRLGRQHRRGEAGNDSRRRDTVSKRAR